MYSMLLQLNHCCFYCIFHLTVNDDATYILFGMYCSVIFSHLFMGYQHRKICISGFRLSVSCFCPKFLDIIQEVQSEFEFNKLTVREAFCVYGVLKYLFCTHVYPCVILRSFCWLKWLALVMGSLIFMWTRTVGVI